jgi:hypothetical protein
MDDYGLLGVPFARASAVGIPSGEFAVQETFYTVPENSLLVIEYVGIGASLRDQEELYTTIMPVFDSGLTVYPIALPGKAASHHPDMPLRLFGGQRVLLYANERVDISAVRSGTEGEAHIEFNISGRLLASNSGLNPPENLSIQNS